MLKNTFSKSLGLKLLQILLGLGLNSSASFAQESDPSNVHRLEYIQYTDFLGFESDKPNGLFQQEIRFKWAINPKFDFKVGDTKFQFFRSLVFPDILINRIDKSKQPVDYRLPALTKSATGRDSLAPRVTTMDLWKYSNLQIGARLILFAIHTQRYRVHLQTGIRLLRNRPYFADTIKSGPDSGLVQSDFRAIYSFAPNVELYFKTIPGKDEKLNMELNLGIFWVKTKDSYYEQFDAGVVDAFERVTRYLPVSSTTRNKVAPIYNVTARINRDIGGSKSNVAFFRINYFYQPGKYTILTNSVAESKQFHNHFLQCQLGVALGLDDLFKGPTQQKSTPISN